MGYDKETRQELQNTEINEDLKKEHNKELLNEIDDGAFEVWKDTNIGDLSNDFIEDNKDDFETYCRDRYDEINAERHI